MRPAAQTRQADQLVLPENVPAAHTTHSVARERLSSLANAPWAHVVHTVACAMLTRPVGQASHAVACAHKNERTSELTLRGPLASCRALQAALDPP